MSKKRVIQHSEQVRHIVWQDGIEIHSRLQIRRKWWHSWQSIYPYKIDFQLREDFIQPQEPARQFIHINPSHIGWFSYSEGHGELEFWDKSTFDLDKRLKEIFEEYISSRRRQQESALIAERQIESL